MQRVAVLASLLAALMLSACATLAPPSPPSGPVILISIDGFRADYIRRGLTPTLAALAAEGATAPDGMRPSFPSLTFPNHYTLVTGLRPDEHGVVNNTMEDAAIPGVTFKLSNKEAVVDRRWWDQATPIWVTAERSGIRTATEFWPGSEAGIQGVRPSYFTPFDKAVTSDARVDQVLAWLDLPAAQRPRFLTLYFDIVDTAGHYDGPQSESLAKAMAGVDTAMARLVEGLKARGLNDQASLIVVADHGMTETPNRIVLDDLAPPEVARVVTVGAVAGLAPMPGHERQAERALLGRREHMTCWRKQDLPKRFHYGRNPRVPPIVCLADEGWLTTTAKDAARKTDDAGKPRKPLVGEHGFDPDIAPMRALFIARGPTIRAGAKLDSFDNVDVYPLLARLLGVRPERNDGRLGDLTPALR